MEWWPGALTCRDLDRWLIEHSNLGSKLVHPTRVLLNIHDGKRSRIDEPKNEVRDIHKPKTKAIT